jgi:release factor glutamine methyltransferase
MLTAAGHEQAPIARLLRLAGQRLSAVSESPRLDAELLLGRATGLDRAGLITHGDECLSPAQFSMFENSLAAREAGRPMAYLLGRREFWSLCLTVSEHTLIPRPETELLVESALAVIDSEAIIRVADLGTGSGAVALALGAERRQVEITATDISEPALAVARANADRLHIKNVAFVAGDWLTPLKGQTFDLIVSNPPYVAEADPHLRIGDLRFEPRMALAAGPDGLDAIRRIVALAPFQMRPGGWLLLEHGHDQGAAVRDLLVAQAFGAVATRRDLAGLERVTLGRRSPTTTQAD